MSWAGLAGGKEDALSGASNIQQGVVNYRVVTQGNVRAHEVTVTNLGQTLGAVVIVLFLFGLVLLGSWLSGTG